ncbi:MAG: hypothetical protein FWD24_06635 [Treponema sp.]|nr:hypothetical protein [Treponema sp.]
MKKIIFSFFIISLLLLPGLQANAQNLSSTSPSQVTFNMEDFPQWAKDLRRGEIVAFGTFPFSLFFVSFTTGMIRWNDANGMDWSDQGRRYAPWPFQSAGGIDLTSDEFLFNILLAAGVSVTLAVADYLIVLNKRNKERQRIESLPPGSTVTIQRRKPGDELPEEDDPEEEEPVEDFDDDLNEEHSDDDLSDEFNDAVGVE